MKNKTPLPFSLFSVLLALALLFPFTLQALHLLKHDSHEHCTENTTTHFHKHDLECDTFNFHLTPVISVSSISFSPLLLSNFKTIFLSFEENYSTNVFFKINLRGPPQYT